MSSNAPIRILAADDHPLLREGIAALIGTERDMQLVAEAATGRETIERFRAVRPDVTLLDIQMPEMSGIDALIAIRSEFPTAKVIILTTYGGDVLAQRALKAGAYAYVLKGLVRKDLLDTIRAVHVGQKRINPQVAAELAVHLGEEPLSEREIEVLQAGRHRQFQQGNRRAPVDHGTNHQGAHEAHHRQAGRQRSYPRRDAGAGPGHPEQRRSPKGVNDMLLVRGAHVTANVGSVAAQRPCNAYSPHSPTDGLAVACCSCALPAARRCSRSECRDCGESLAT